MRSVIILALLVASLLLAGCAERGFDSGPLAFHADPPIPLGETVIYELYPRSFTEEANLQAIIPRLDELQALGVTHIWLMPIHPIGETLRKGTLGSPYSIADYKAINPEFGSLEDFRALVEAVHEHGMFAMMDLVANHTAWDHHWLTENPDWYVKGEDGEITHPPGTDWTDVAQLDFSNLELRAAMREVMRFWVEEVGIDGYRADVAELVPYDFWQEAIAELRQIRPVLMLAEGHDAALHDAGFDLTYSWTTYHPVKEVWRGTPVDTLDLLVRYELEHYPLHGRLRFTTNHDETAWDDTPIALFGGTRGAQAAAVITKTLPGVPLVYNGQEVGDPQRLPLFERVPIDWQADPHMRAFYRDLLHRRRHSPALQYGDYESLEHDRPRDVLAFQRTSERDTATVVVNTRDREVTVTFVDGRTKELEPYGWRIY